MLSDVLGMSPQESNVYRALISVPSATPAELADLVGGDTTDVTHLLSLLEDKGLTARSLGDTRRFVASPPAAALRSLLIQRQNEIKLAELEISSLDEIYRTATLSRGVADVVDVVHGAEAIRERFGQLQLGAREEVMSFVKAPVTVISSAENVAEHAALARGVRYRVLLERAMLNDGANSFEEIVHARDAGEEVRISETLPLKLIIVDREYAFVPLLGSADVARAGALLVHESGLLDALIALFESEWASATQVVTSADTISEVAGGQVDDLDVQIVSLLLTGLTDHAVATHLNTSLRTVQRRVRSLMDLAQVQTRMQLGFQAARLGWLDAT